MVNKGHIALAVTVVAIALTVYYTGLHQYLTFESLREHRQLLLRWKAAAGFEDNLENDEEFPPSRIVTIIRERPLLLPIAYVLIYTSLVACSVPGATVLTLAAGILFDQPYSTVFAVSGAATGACILFQLASSTPLARTLRRKIGFVPENEQEPASPPTSPSKTSLEKRNGVVEPSSNRISRKGKAPKNALLDRIGKGFHSSPSSATLNTLSNGLYLLLLRQVPIFPFWFVNIAPSVFGIPFWVFAVTTYVGVIPGSYVYTELGRTLLDALKDDESDSQDDFPDLSTFMRKALFSKRLVVPLTILFSWITFLLFLRYLLSSYQKAAAEAEKSQGASPTTTLNATTTASPELSTRRRNVAS
eukprot:TRINITY_DN7634_c0_g1_i1.p1 TRINITY_DN7634_c0_g1~~TRINITY_DN7634_c0_g1_i1.p1  ORF type:complete len:360 (+),score=46.51 TRINITY_DN7634_c0_g1_i1:79-1158(+)